MNNEVHQCEEDGCESAETEFFYYFMTKPGEPEGAWMCREHAAISWCLWCHHFGAGSEEFDFSGHPGYHRECWQELLYEVGESDDEDDYDDAWDYYPADWYDPSSPVSEIEPEETPREIYIGPGSEFGAEDE